MMLNFSAKTAALLISLLLTLTAHAALVQRDLWAAGDRLLTEDSSSGLVWLDMSITDGLSLSAIASRVELGGDLENFRLATKSELEFAWSKNGTNYNWNNPNAAEFLNAVGTTWDSYNFSGNDAALGYYAETNSLSYMFIGSLGKDGSATTENLFGFDATRGYQEVGAFLVLENAQTVPEPNSAALLTLAFIAASLGRRCTSTQRITCVS